MADAVLKLTRAPADLARLHPWLDRMAGLHGVPPAARFGMQVAVEEAVANVALHGFAADDAGSIAVAVQRVGDAIDVTVEDSGRAFDPTQAAVRPRARSLAEAEPGGLGLGLLRHYCSSVGYERRGDRNRLTLRFVAGTAGG